MRQMDGAFGVAILAAVFATAGGYTSAAAFSDGFAAATGLALDGALAGRALPGGPGQARDASAERVATNGMPRYVVSSALEEPR